MRFSSSEHDCMLHIYLMQQMLEVQDMISEEEADKKEQQLGGYMRLFQSKGGSWE